MKAQAMLLCFLEEQRVLEKPQVRIVATTTAELEELAKEGSFRKNLFYRLRVLEIVIPTLRERKEDIPSLVAHFIRKYAYRFGLNVERISKRALQMLISYS